MSCDNFFKTESMIAPNVVGFERFDSVHITWLAVIVVVAIALGLLFRRLPKKGQTALRVCVGSALLGSQLFRIAILFALGKYNIGYLPLHICTMSIYILFIDSVLPNRLTRELCYAVSLPGTVFALILPNWVGLPFDNFVHVTSFVIHGLIAIYPVMLLIGGELRPKLSRLPLCVAFLLAVSIPVYFFNRHFGTNYMFINRPEAGTPLEWFAKYLGNPGYLLGFVAIAAAVWFVMYSPYIVMDICRKRKALSEK